MQTARGSILGWRSILTVLLFVTLASAAFGQWSAPLRLNLASETGNDVKGPRVVGGSDGFHSVYVTNAGQIRYRRYVHSTQTLNSPVTIYSGFLFNAMIGIAPNGDVHVVYEEWGHSGDDPKVGWVKGPNQASSWGSAIDIAASGGSGKHPHITGLGVGSSDDALLTYFHTSSKDMHYAVYNGSSWGSDLDMGTNGNSEYEVFGMARSPVDGSVWRSYDNGPALVMRQYVSGSWGPEITLDGADGMHNRQKLAVNDSGQVMCIWDQDDKLYAVIYTPGSGVGSRITVSTEHSWGQALTSVPGSTNFYVAYPKNPNGGGAVYGRSYAGGGFLAEEKISNGMPEGDDFTVDPQLSADPAGSGNLYLVWEYWGNGKPQGFYSVKPGNLMGPKGTLAGTVRNQFNVPLPGAVITVVGSTGTVTDANGNYTVQVTPGTYTVNCTKNYYSTSTSNNVPITQNVTTVRDFTISGQAPSPVTGVVATGGNQSIQLTWANPGSAQHNGSRIRVKTTGIPTSPTDGSQVADVSKTTTSYNHTGLTNGQTYYYAVFAYYEDYSRYYAGGVGSSANPAGPADLDRDGDVDQDDFAKFQRCLTGSANPQNDPNCARAKLDVDQDVDGDDLIIFMECASGAGIPSNPACN